MKPLLCIQISGGIIYAGSDNEILRTPTDLRDPAVAPMGLEGDKPFRFVVFKDSGLFIGTGRTLSGQRGGNYMAAWLYFPRDIAGSIKGVEVVKWLNELERGKDTDKDHGIINNYLLSPDKNKLKVACEAFVKRLPSLSSSKTPHAFKAPEDGVTAYALRTYKSDDEAIKLLSPEYICQPGDEQYKGIMLLPRDGKPIECRLTDITPRTLRKAVAVCRPASLPANVRATVRFDGEERELTRDSGLSVFTGEEITIVLSHVSGCFKPEEVSVTVGENGLSALPQQIEWEMTVASDLFVVADSETGERVKGCLVSLNGKVLEAEQSFKVAKARSVKLIVRAQGYKSFEKNISLLNSSDEPRQAILIQLTQEKEEHHYDLALNDGTLHTITLWEPKDRWASPLKGFDLHREEKAQDMQGRKPVASKGEERRRLVRVTRITDRSVRKYMLIAGILGMAIGALLCYIFVHQ